MGQQKSNIIQELIELVGTMSKSSSSNRNSNSNSSRNSNSNSNSNCNCNNTSNKDCCFFFGTARNN